MSIPEGPHKLFGDVPPDEPDEPEGLDVADLFQKMWPGTVVRRHGNETEIILPPEDESGDDTEPTQL